ncbi:hypothetical protein ACQKCU_17710 [Heyndrickxia sporothermodurans]
MNKFLKLTNFEINRFKKIYFILLLITIGIQILDVIISSMMYMNKAKRTMLEQKMTAVQFIQENGSMDFTYFLRSTWFLAPILICITAFIFYIFIIWYRDWFGKNTFIYRLLMLPTSRMNIILAKGIAIFVLVLGLVALQFLLFPIENSLFKWIVSPEFRIDMTIDQIVGSSKEISFIIPNSFIDFIIHYGIGILAVFVVFTGILFERSYRLKGIIFGVVYAILSIVILYAPYLVSIFQQNLYPMELLIIEIVLFIIVFSASLFTSNFLLKKKVSV